MRNDLKEFMRAFWNDWLALMSGAASVILAFIGTVASQKDGLPPWLIWVAAVVCLLISAFRIWKREHSVCQALREELTPKLEIVGIGPTSNDHYRITVRNVTCRHVRFRARLTQSSRPDVGYPLPVFLQATHRGPYDEAELPGYGFHHVDVFVDHGPQTELGLKVMGFPAAEHPISRKQRYELRICVYPVSENGQPVDRWFYIIPQLDDTILFGAS